MFALAASRFGVSWASELAIGFGWNVPEAHEPGREIVGEKGDKMTKQIDPEILDAWADAQATDNGPTAGPAVVTSSSLVEAVPAVASRGKGGRGSWIKADERREIQIAHLTDHLNQTELARRFSRNREAIAGCLKGEDFEKLRQGVQDELRAIARQKLEAGVEVASDAWVASVGIAAAKGDHRPAKDLLQATGVVEREAARHGNVVVVVGMPGAAAGPDPFIDVAPGGE